MSEPSGDLQRSFTHCERAARRAARNFYYGFAILPRAKRRALCSVYAFMRYADDLADEPGEARSVTDSLAAWREALGRVYEGGSTTHLLLPAFRDTVQRYSLPRGLFEDLIDGVRMDTTIARYETFDDLSEYCYRVAGVVGLICLRIWGVSDAEAADALGKTCGTAFQMTNILRDIREDGQRGRIYLPQEDLLRFGVTEEDVLQGRGGERLRNLVSYEVARTEAMYRQSEPLVQLVSRDSRAAFLTMFRIYRAVLRRIAKRPEAVLQGRVRLSAAAKVGIVVGSLRAARATDPR